MENALKRSKSHIYCALLKYGHSNFSLTILEYCNKDKCIEREDFYLSSENHEYNILEKAGSTLGSTRNNKGENNPFFGKNHTEKTKKIMSDAKKGENHPNYGKPKYEGTGIPSEQIEVTDITNNTINYYDSIREAARALNLPSHKQITNYIKNNQKKPYKGQYIFKKIK